MPSPRVPGTELAVPAVSKRTKPFTRGDEEYARLCIRIAKLRSEHISYIDIALSEGLATPADAKRLAAQGFALIPADDIHEGRRAANEDLHRLAQEMWDSVLDPGPLVSQGKIMRKLIGYDAEDKPVYGDPYPDVANRVRAGAVILSLHERLARMNGLDAPKQTIVANVPIEEIRAYVERLRREVASEPSDGEAEVA